MAEIVSHQEIEEAFAPARRVLGQLPDDRRLETADDLVKRAEAIAHDIRERGADVGGDREGSPA